MERKGEREEEKERTRKKKGSGCPRGRPREMLRKLTKSATSLRGEDIRRDLGNCLAPKSNTPHRLSCWKINETL